MDVKGLSKEDLYLLMESYKNMITLNATLAEQQKHLMENQEKIIVKQDMLATKQTSVCDRINTMIDRIDTWTNTTKAGHDEIQNTCTGLEESLQGKMDKILDNQTSIVIENTKQHEGIKNHIYGAYIALGSIIASVLTMIYFVYSHNDKAGELLKLLQKIAVKLGVQLIS